MEDVQIRISEYKKLAAETADALRKAADALEHGELPTGEEDQIGDVLVRLKEARDGLKREAEEMGADVSHVHTVEELKRRCGRCKREDLLLPLDAIQTLTASEEKYAGPLKELQDRAELAAQSLRTAGGPASEESRRIADQARTILSVLDSGGPEAGREENVFSSLGISDTILLGLMLGKYSRAESVEGKEERPAKADDADRENVPEDAAANGEGPAEETPAAENEDEEVPYPDGIVHPLHKLPKDRKPNARRFLKAVREIGPPAAAAVMAVYYNDLSTVSQAAAETRNDAEKTLSPRLEEEMLKVMRQLVQAGILAAYNVFGKTVYIFTRFGMESVKMPEVQRTLPFLFLRAPENPEIVAKEAMPVAELLRLWALNEMHARLNTWIRRETGHNLVYGWDGARRIEGHYATILPEGYGRDDEAFLVEAYVGASNDEKPCPVLYVVVDDTNPLEDNVEAKEGTLLLVQDKLYERRDGAWVKKQRSLVHGTELPLPKPPAWTKTRKSKKGGHR